MAIIENPNFQTIEQTRITQKETMHQPLTKVNASDIKDDEQHRKTLEERYQEIRRRYPCFQDEVQRAQEKSLRELPSFSSSGQNETVVGSSRLPYNTGVPLGGASNVNDNEIGTSFGNTSISPPQPNNLGASVSTSILQSNQTIAREHCPSDYLQLLKEKAQYPHYADIEERVRSFRTWNNASQDPKVLAEAGFFYTGDEDRVRCFMCNGGLCNFERDDIPWFEHQKWFGNCPYLNKCITSPVVAAILETATTINGPLNIGCSNHQHGNGQTQCDLNSITPGHPPTGSATEKESEKQTPERGDQKGASSDAHKDLESLRLENESLKQTRTCKVCLEEPVSVIFLPCRHLVCCVQCSVQLQECPICRGEIRATAKVHI